MTIYLLKDYPEYAATSLADAQALFSALQDPSDADNAATIDRVQGKLAPLIQSDTGEPLVISSIDDTAGTISTWVTDASTTLALGLGDPDTNSNSLYAFTDDFTIGDDERTGTLNLNTVQMAAAINRGRSAGRHGGLAPTQFTLQLRKTTDGATETLGLLSITVLPGVVTGTPVNITGPEYLTATEIASVYAPKIAPVFTTSLAVGTATPATLVEISSATAATSATTGAKLRISGNGNSSSSAAEIQLYDKSADVNWNLGMRDATDSGSFRIAHGTFGANERDDLVIAAGGAIGLGTDNPQQHVHVVAEMGATDNADGLLVEGRSTVTGNGTAEIFAISGQATHQRISAGITESGGRVGVTGDAYSNSTDFAGTIAYQRGIRGRAGFAFATSGAVAVESTGGFFEVINEAAGASITNAYGVKILNEQTTGTITNRYGLSAVSTGLAAQSIAGYFYASGATENYSIYAPAGRGYFGESVGIGFPAPLSALSVNGGVHIGGASDAGDNNLLVDGVGTFGSLAVQGGGSFLGTLSTSSGYQFRGDDDTSYEVLRYANGTNNPGLFAKVVEASKSVFLNATGSVASGHKLKLGAGTVDAVLEVNESGVGVTGWGTFSGQIIGATGYRFRGDENTAYELLRYANGTNNPGLFAKVVESSKDVLLTAGGSSTSGQKLKLGANSVEGVLEVRETGIVATVPSTAPALGTNSTMTFELTSNTSLAVKVRGSDGTTRSATLTLS